MYLSLLVAEPPCLEPAAPHFPEPSLLPWCLIIQWVSMGCACYGLNCVPTHPKYVEILTPVPGYVTLFGKCHFRYH